MIPYNFTGRVIIREDVNVQAVVEIEDGMVVKVGIADPDVFDAIIRADISSTTLLNIFQDLLDEDMTVTYSPKH